MDFVLALTLAFVSSMFFWPAAIVLFIILSVALESEKMPGTLFFSSLAVGGLIYTKWFMGLSITGMGIGLAVGTYILMGVSWSFIKWFVKLRKIRTMFIHKRDDYLRDNGLPAGFFREDMTDDKHTVHHAKFARSLSNLHGFSRAHCASTAQDALERIKPLVGDNKTTITLWIGYWPASVLCFIFNDMLKEIFETVYNTVSEWFQEMSNKMFKDLV